MYGTIVSIYEYLFKINFGGSGMAGAGGIGGEREMVRPGYS
jgi:hypothetical protein